MVGAFGGLFPTGMTLNIFSMIGLIMLMGLVTKNAILLVDFANHLRGRGQVDARGAAWRPARSRLRPILMTTSAMIFGMLPVALALGEGGETRAPMAVAVIGGLITSTLLTLVVVPVVYILDEPPHHQPPRALARAARDGRGTGGDRRWAHDNRALHPAGGAALASPELARDALQGIGPGSLVGAQRWPAGHIPSLTTKPSRQTR